MKRISLKAEGSLKWIFRLHPLSFSVFPYTVTSFSCLIQRAFTRSVNDTMMMI